MQKFPEVPLRKRRWRMRKKKRHFLLTKGTKHFFFSFRQCPSNQQHHFAVWCLGTTHTSLDVASVSPFHPVAALPWSTLCWNMQDPQLNYKLTLTGLWQNSKRKLTLMETRNTKCGHLHTWNDLTYFWHFNWGDSTISMYSGKIPSSTEWLLNPVNKGKYKRNVFVSYLFCLFFCIILLGLSWARHCTD